MDFKFSTNLDNKTFELVRLIFPDGVKALENRYKTQYEAIILKGYKDNEIQRYSFIKLGSEKDLNFDPSYEYFPKRVRALSVICKFVTIHFPDEIIMNFPLDNCNFGETNSTLSKNENELILIRNKALSQYKSHIEHNYKM